MYEEHSEEPMEEIEVEAIGIEIATQPIELFKIFKLANLVGSGGEAKHIISEGYVAVNGELETRKRRKLYDGDLVEFNQEFYLIICDESGEFVAEPDEQYYEDNPMHSSEHDYVEPESNGQNEPEQAEEEVSTPENNKKSGKGRKSISFF
ncbi:RNA-binding S4 domain-containing protein [Vibrio hannami]|uniref:RNA-binding S4 domain-containing protein n=1 Tax=Vibrio hannami TaxID=2717094 RepID=UPI0024103558|nr:RNA-binding S4 domain-containing protein [Vibrio hannami]MDG3085779.1 RNA-binding S4 domain-containing protein [Vibrio hannami]